MNKLLLLTMLLTMTSCARYIDIRPSKASVTPSVEWEIQEYTYTKTKPKVQATLEWLL